jgi:hypothetical protein
MPMFASRGAYVGKPLQLTGLQRPQADSPHPAPILPERILSMGNGHWD